jgi:hypothetical protein
MADVDAQIGFARTDGFGRQSLPRTPLFAVLTIIAVALFVRIGEINNPLTHVDDQFYLFTGKAMLNGELPYVDVWDRKPIGLFLIYAAIAALGGNSVLTYHLVAAAFAIATGVIIYRIALRFTDGAGALRAAIVYEALLSTMGGEGGQSPVFYNLLMAVAALCAFDAFVRGKAVRKRAIVSMLLVGISIQIKPTTLFEGAFFGLILLAAQFRRDPRFASVARLAVLQLLVAGAPTAIAFASYAAIGHAGDMWFATVSSIFHRSPLTWDDRTSDIPQMLFFLTVPTLVTLSALVNFVKRGASRLTLFVVGWMLAAVVGFLSVPNFFNHYTLPLMLPMAVAMAPLLADRRDGMMFAIMAVAIPILIKAPNPHDTIHRRDGFDRTAALVQRELKGGCLYVFYGPTQFYTATNACHFSPYVFPDHLETEVESTALPVRPEAEVQRIFEQRPTVVITGYRSFLKRNNRSAQVVERNLACNYVLTKRVGTAKDRTLDLWTLKALSSAACPSNHPPLGIVQPPGS